MDKLVVKVTCPFCGYESVIVVNEKDFYAWQNGKLVQKAFPYLNAAQRETLISDICEKCQNKIFGEEEA